MYAYVQIDLFYSSHLRLKRFNAPTGQGIYAERLPRWLIFFFKYTGFCISSVRKNVNYKEAFS